MLRHKTAFPNGLKKPNYMRLSLQGSQKKAKQEQKLQKEEVNYFANYGKYSKLFSGKTRYFSS